jgi:Myb-like DNA-binding domain
MFRWQSSAVAEIEAVALRIEGHSPAVDATNVLRLLDDAIAGEAGNSSTSSTAEATPPKPAATSPQPVVPKEPVEWTPEEMKRLTKALTKNPVGTVDRYQKLADFVGSRTAAECLAMVNAKRAKNVAAAAPAVIVASMGNDFERFERERKKCDIQSKEAPPVMATTEAPAAPAAEQRPNGSAAEVVNGTANSKIATLTKPPNSANFTPKQQAQLESAMKKYPVSLGVGRWVSIASEVSGRSSDECERRFLELVAFYKAKKNADKK